MSMDMMWIWRGGGFSGWRGVGRDGCGDVAGWVVIVVFWLDAMWVFVAYRV